MMADMPEDPENIERNLAETRARMDQRLDALQDRLTPAKLADNIARNVLSDAKANPIPIALIGIGLGWMALARSDQATDRPADGGQASDGGMWARIREAEARITRGEGESDADYRTRLDHARGEMLGISRSPEDSNGSYAWQVRKAMASAASGFHDARHRVGDTFGKIGEKVGLGSSSHDSGGRRRGSVSMPSGLAIGGIAVALGALAGGLLPISRQEKAVLGSTATRIRSAGHDATQRLLDRGTEVAQEALGAVDLA